jgi:hypothetical protein
LTAAAQSDQTALHDGAVGCRNDVLRSLLNVVAALMGPIQRDPDQRSRASDGNPQYGKDRGADPALATTPNRIGR